MQVNPMFASRDTLEEAVSYANELIGSLPAESRLPALTALHVVLNTALAQAESVNPKNLVPNWENAVSAQSDLTSAKGSLQFLRDSTTSVALIAYDFKGKGHPASKFLGRLTVALTSYFGLTPDTLEDELQKHQEWMMEDLMENPERLLSALRRLKAG